MATHTETGVPVVVREATGPSGWDQFVESHPDGTVEHLFAWHPIFRTVFRQQPAYLAARRGNTIVGVLPLVLVPSLLIGRSAVSLPYTSYGGIVTSDADAADALVATAVDIARGFGARHVELRNSRRVAADSVCREHKVGARLSLPGTTEALWTTLDRKVRNQVRKAQKEGLVAHRGGAELLDEFYAVFAENMRDLGTPVFPRALFADALRTLPAASVFVVRQGSSTIAGSITLSWRERVLVPWASALRRFRALSPNMLLYWTMIEAAIAGGYQTFDFGRSTRDGGTHHFKQQWGASDIPLYWESVPVNASHAAGPSTAGSNLDVFVDVWRHLPLGVANLVGPHLIRHVV